MKKGRFKYLLEEYRKDGVPVIDIVSIFGESIIVTERSNISYFDKYFIVHGLSSTLAMHYENVKEIAI